MKWCVWLFVFEYFLGKANLKVTWYVRTIPIIIGGNLTLFCNTSTIPCDDCPSQWYQGNNVLSFYDRVSNSNKYSVEHEKDGFALTIKNLTFEHFNRSYGCSYDYASFTKNLTLPRIYEYHPRQTKTNLTHEIVDNTLYMSLTFLEVHPKPVCSVHLDAINISTALKTVIVDKGLFFDVALELMHTPENTCDGRLVVECLIGSKNETFMDSHIQFNCDDGLYKTMANGTASWSTDMTVTIFFVIIVFIF